MDSKVDPRTKISTTRYKCSACYKQFKRKEHLVEHMKISFHSPHQPKCVVCQKHCKSFESLREHLTGLLSKANCSRIFSNQGCNLCLNIFDSPTSLSNHREKCCLSAPTFDTKIHPCTEQKISTLRRVEAIAIDCEMVGGGSDGSLDLCARVCLVDEYENVIFHTYVQPHILVTDYRYEVTGLTEEHLKDAMPFREVQEKLQEILYNGESAESIRCDGGKARLLVGHSLEYDFDCLRMKYPDHLVRDTARYRPLKKTNLVSHSLKYLTRTYLGYDIQTGKHDPYEDCVSAMRLYKRMRDQDHLPKFISILNSGSGFDSWKLEELEKLSPDELYDISKPDYRCWCLDSKPTVQQNDQS